MLFRSLVLVDPVPVARRPKAVQVRVALVRAAQVPAVLVLVDRVPVARRPKAVQVRVALVRVVQVPVAHRPKAVQMQVVRELAVRANKLYPVLAARLFGRRQRSDAGCLGLRVPAELCTKVVAFLCDNCNNFSFAWFGSLHHLDPRQFFYAGNPHEENIGFHCRFIWMLRNGSGIAGIRIRGGSSSADQI